jgi:UBX domain-containing protein 1/4
VVAGSVKSVEELVEAIETVKKTESTSPQQQSSSSSTSVPASSTDEVVCEDGVCYKKPKEPETAAASPSTEKNETEDEKQEKIKKAMKLIEQKRIERIQEEQRLEKEKEVQRRKEGQDIIALKKWQDDQEMKQLKEDRIRERNEEKAARQRVLDQIEQDKKERAQRFANQTGSTEIKPVTPPTGSPPVNSNSARIQFKKPNGESEIVTFDSGMLFADLHLFVKNDILQGSVKDFTLATAFPRREFSQVDFDKTLQQLSLTPSSTLLIIFGKKSSTFSSGPSGVLPTQTDGSFFAMISALFLGLMTPVVALFTYLKNFAMRGNQAEAGESANEAGKRKRNEEVLAPNDA